MINKIEIIVYKMKESFDGNPWVGESLLHKLNKLDYRFSNMTAANSNHSIAMIVQHLINWRVFAIEKINNNEAYDITMNSTGDWTKININTQSEWINLLDKLISTQNKIIELLEGQMINISLDYKVSGKDYSFDYLLNGIIQHDIYHSGQIGLLYAQLINRK